MVKLSVMAALIENYLKQKGDKHIVSIGTCYGGDIEYQLHLCDIYDGPLGDNPYSRRDSIAVPKDGYELESEEKQKASLSKIEQKEAEEKAKNMQAYFSLEEELRKADDKPLDIRLAELWGALSVMQRMGQIDSNMVQALWNDFALDKLNLQ